MTQRGEDDRRFGPRIPVEMWVESLSERDLYYQRSANLSTGGIYFDSAVPQPPGTRVTLQFTLPGDSERLRVRGEVVARSGGGPVGMSVKFVELDEKSRLRIEGFVAAHVGSPSGRGA